MRNNKVREILELAVPATVESILQTLVGFIDTLMISRLGLLAVTAVGISGNIFAIYLAVFIALGVGTSSLISRYLGAGKPEEARRIAVQSTGLALVSGALFGAASLVFSRQLLGLLGAQAEVVTKALPFFQVVGAASVLISLLTVFGTMLRATGDARTPLMVNSLVNVLNVGLDMILIFGLGPIPALGILGTAIGTVLARLIGVILMYRKIRQSKVGFSVSDVFARSNYTELVRLAVPAALERLVMRLGQVLYFGMIISMGVKTYAAHSIAGNLEAFNYMPAFGLAAAASVLVGNQTGKGDRKAAYEYGVLSFRLGACVMAALGIIMFIGSPWFATWFTRDAEAIRKIVTALRIDTFAQVPLAANLIYAGALQGQGDTQSPLYSTIIGMWGLRVVGVYILGIRLDWDIAGVWLAILIDITMRAIFLFLRFRRRSLAGEPAILLAKPNE